MWQFSADAMPSRVHVCLAELPVAISFRWHGVCTPSLQRMLAVRPTKRTQHEITINLKEPYNLTNNLGTVIR